MHVQHIVEARSGNHSYCGNAVSIAYSKCMFVALVIHHAVRITALYCHLWPVRRYHIFPHYPINGTIVVEKLLNTKCVL